MNTHDDPDRIEVLPVLPGNLLRFGRVPKR
jgi:hypothetical protein